MMQHQFHLQLPHARLEQGAGLAHQCRQVAQGGLGSFVAQQQLQSVHDRSGTFALGQHPVERAACRVDVGGAVVEPAPNGLRTGGDCGERLADFMHDRSREFAERGETAGGAQLGLQRAACFVCQPLLRQVGQHAEIAEAAAGIEVGAAVAVEIFDLRTSPTRNSQ